MFQYSDADYQPGTIIYHHPEHHYRRAPGISASEVKVFANECPAHYQHRFLGEPAIRTESAAMVLGSMVHNLVLEPHVFDQRYLVQPEPGELDLVTVPQLKAWLKDHNLNQAGNKSELIERILQQDPDAPVWAAMEEKRKQSKKKTVKPELMEQAHYMAESVLSNPQARQLLSRGDAEVSVWGKHEETGLLIKARPDWLREGICIDLKTCACSSPQAFGRDFVKYGYDLQQAHYTSTLTSAGIEIRAFAFIAVENEPPFITQVYLLNNEGIKAAFRRWEGIMKRLAECLEKDEWPGYADGETELTLPRWYYQQYAAEVDHDTA